MARFSSLLNRYVRGDTVTPVASAARSASGNSGQLEADFVAFDFLVDVTAVAGGTPSLTVSIEESSDGTTWNALVTGAAITAVGTQRLRGVVQRRFYRVVWTITGTGPSFTFSVTGDTK